MATLTIPVNSDTAFYSFNVDLENTNYFFTFQWNERYERWLLTVSDVEETPLMSGVALEPGVNLLSLVASDDLPPGQLYLLSEASGLEVCGRQDLGNVFFLAYVESEA